MPRSGGARRRYLLVLLVLTAVTLVTLDQRRDSGGVIGAAGGVASDILGPVRSASDAAWSPVRDFFGGLTEGGSLREENDELRRRLDQLEAQLQRAEDAIRRNEELSAVLDVEDTFGIPRIAARVVSPAPGNFEQTVVVDKGRDDGIRVGMPVVSGDGLVGRVVEPVGRSQAKVLLLTDERFSVSVRIPGADDASAVATGRGSNDPLSLEFLDPESGVVAGDAVVTSGRLPSRFPPDLPVGRVSSLRERPGETALEGRVRPVVDVSRLEYVAVLDWRPPPPVVADDEVEG